MLVNCLTARIALCSAGQLLVCMHSFYVAEQLPVCTHSFVLCSWAAYMYAQLLLSWSTARLYVQLRAQPAYMHSFALAVDCLPLRTALCSAGGLQVCAKCCALLMQHDCNEVHGCVYRNCALLPDQMQQLTPMQSRLVF